MWLPALRLHQGGTNAPGRVLWECVLRECVLRERVSRKARGSIKSVLARALLAAATLCVAACGATPAEPVPFKTVSADRIVKPGYTEPASGKAAVDIRRERTDDVIVRFRDALVYVDGERVADLMNGEHIVFYLTPGLHRLAVSTQFDPVRELQFIVTADPRYTNRASITFDADHRIVLTRVAQ
ncbi:hypothetical protein PBS_29040 [Paraburkholderia sp. 2C]